MVSPTREASNAVAQLRTPPDKERRLKITVRTRIEAPIAKVWQAYTTPEDIKAWNAASDDWHTTAATVDLREGGTFSSRMEARDGSFGFDFAGTYTRIVRHRLIEYAFGDRMGAVEFADGGGGVTVCVTFDAETQHPIEAQRQGWQAILDNFARYVVARGSSGDIRAHGTARIQTLLQSRNAVGCAPYLRA